jgi:hypothetical protein
MSDYQHEHRRADNAIPDGPSWAKPFDFAAYVERLRRLLAVVNEEHWAGAMRALSEGASPVSFVDRGHLHATVGLLGEIHRLLRQAEQHTQLRMDDSSLPF